MPRLDDNFAADPDLIERLEDHEFETSDYSPCPASSTEDLQEDAVPAVETPYFGEEDVQLLDEPPAPLTALLGVPSVPVELTGTAVEVESGVVVAPSPAETDNADALSDGDAAVDEPSRRRRRLKRSSSSSSSSTAEDQNENADALFDLEAAVDADQPSDDGDES